jgi:aspartate carbamoyltransferase regulatory subunit
LPISAGSDWQKAYTRGGSIRKCNNPKCITNNEPMNTVFHVVNKEKGILKCHYCDKEQFIEKVELV